MAQVIWTATGLNTLREVIDYIAQQSPATAEKVRQRIVQAPRILEQFPEFGARVPEYEREHVRELLVKPYRILYLIRGETCHVVHVLRGTRDLKSLLRLDDLEAMG